MFSTMFKSNKLRHSVYFKISTDLIFNPQIIAVKMLDIVQFGVSSFHCLVSLLPQCLASHLKVLWKMFKHDVKLWGYWHLDYEVSSQIFLIFSQFLCGWGRLPFDEKFYTLTLSLSNNYLRQNYQLCVENHCL